MPRTASATRHRLEAQLLGGLALRYDGQPVPETAFRRRRSRTLLLLLLVEPSHRLPTDTVLGLLWPERDLQASAADLRSVLGGIRAAFPDASAPNPVARQGLTLALHPALTLSIDLDRFEAASSHALEEGGPAAIGAALALYTGPLLPSLPHEEWVLDRRAALARRYRQLLLALAAEGDADPSDTAARLRAILVEDPTDEEAGQALLRLLGAHGRRAEALRVYQAMVAALREDLGVAPSGETEALRAALLVPVPAPLAPAGARPSAPTARHNLPAPLSSFVGRTWERAALRHLLDRTRLLTLVGPGGCGKTRLALTVAEERLGAHPDGVWLVELASVGDGGLAARALARALGLRETAGGDLADALTAHLVAKAALLLLDNCEHILEAVAELADRLLRACPHLRLLATSRERLGLTGEYLWRVPPLSLPPLPADAHPGGTPSLAQLIQAEAVQLFVARARAVRPGFALTAENAHAVGQICRRLDGIPLALELAAARADVLAVGQIAARLDDRFRLLTGGSRAALPRQQTLRASIDWSHDLLDEPGQVLLRRLAVFAGGWTLEAAETVAAEPPNAAPRGGEDEPPLAADAVLDGLARLVEQSLVQPGEQVEGRRYRMLETVHEYARGRLEQSGELDVLRDRHLAWCVHLAEQAAPALRGPRQLAWLGRLEDEHGNLRVALGWAQHHGSVVEGLRLAAALGRYWELRGHLREGSGWIRGLLSLADGAPEPVPEAVRARALYTAGCLARRLGDLKGAALLLEAALALWRAMGDGQGVASALMGLGAVRSTAGDRAAAQACWEECLALHREGGDMWGISVALGNLAILADVGQQYQAAVTLYEEAIRIQRQLGDSSSLAAALSNLGKSLTEQGDHARAAPALEESLALHRQAGDKRGQAVVLLGLGALRAEQGAQDRAAAAYREGLALAWKVGDRYWVAASLEMLAWLECARERPERGATLLGAAAAQWAALRVAPHDPAGHERAVDQLKAALGERVFSAAWSAGGDLPVEQIIAEGLSF